MLPDHFCFLKAGIHGKCICQNVIVHFMTKVTNKQTKIIYAQAKNNNNKKIEGMDQSRIVRSHTFGPFREGGILPNFSSGTTKHFPRLARLLLLLLKLQLKLLLLLKHLLGWLWYWRFRRRRRSRIWSWARRSLFLIISIDRWVGCTGRHRWRRFFFFRILSKITNGKRETPTKRNRAQSLTSFLNTGSAENS